MIRIGHGYDVHRFGGDGPLTISATQIPFKYGFIAHSDGDVALHALCDALLGALALGDIGYHFPDHDPAYAKIESTKLLTHVYELVQAQGFRLVNLDLTIIAQEPRMAPYIDSMRTAIVNYLQIKKNQVNLKVKTTESLGFTGRKEGIASHCVVLVESVR